MTDVTGLDEAINDINQAIQDYKKISQERFWEFGLKILATAQKELRESVVTGNLRASGYARPPQGGAKRPNAGGLDPQKNGAIPGDQIGDLGVEVGFTAVYALNVHENSEGARTPKFLENPVVRNKDKLAEILKS